MDMVKMWLRDLTDVAVSLIALGIAVNVVFGAHAPFIPDVIGSLNSILMELGSQQLVGLMTLLIAVVLLPALIGLYALPAWAPERLSAGLFRRRSPGPSTFNGPDAHFDIRNQHRVILYYDDGPTATVTVRERTGKAPRPDRSIYVNGKSDGNLIADYPTMSLLALIPALMAEKVERCFVVGFGTGVSTGELAARFE